MTAYTYLVAIDVERDSGLFASREDISEILEEAITEGLDNASLSGLGPNSDSEYSAQQVDVQALDKKAERAALQEYDAHVVQDLPGDAKLRAEVKSLRAQLTEAHRLLNASKDRVIALTEEREQGKTRIYQEDSIDFRDPVRTYIPDGPYNRTFFAFGERRDDRFEIRLNDDNDLVLRCEAFADLAVIPRSSNEVIVRRLDK